MEETKPFNYLAVAIVAILLIAAGYLIWNQSKHKGQDQNSNTAEQPVPPEVQKQMDEQKVYKNAAGGFSVKIPDGWVHQNSSNGDFFVSSKAIQAEQQNRINCAQNKPTCNSEFIVNGVSFSNKSSIKDAVGGVTKTTINDIEYSTFKTNGLVDSFCDEATSGTKTVSFCSVDKDALALFMENVTLTAN